MLARSKAVWVLNCFKQRHRLHFTHVNNFLAGKSCQKRWIEIQMPKYGYRISASNYTAITCTFAHFKLSLWAIILVVFDKVSAFIWAIDKSFNLWLIRKRQGIPQKQGPGHFKTSGKNVAKSPLCEKHVEHATFLLMWCI